MDMVRTIASLLLSWTLLLGPALCMGGLLAHDCDCGNEVDSECPHEEACGDDPCTTMTRPEDRDAEGPHDAGVSPVPAVLCPLTAGSPPGSGWTGPPRPLDQRQLPYPPSDRPLRI